MVVSQGQCCSWPHALQAHWKWHVCHGRNMVLHVLLPAATVPCTELAAVLFRAAAAVQRTQCGTSIPVFQPVADVREEEWAPVAEVPQSCPIAASPDSGHAEEACGLRIHPGEGEGIQTDDICLGVPRYSTTHHTMLHIRFAPKLRTLSPKSKTLVDCTGDHLGAYIPEGGIRGV